MKLNLLMDYFIIKYNFVIIDYNTFIYIIPLFFEYIHVFLLYCILEYNDNFYILFKKCDYFLLIKIIKITKTILFLFG